MELSSWASYKSSFRCVSSFSLVIFLKVRKYIHRTREILFIAQEPDDKTVFGFVSRHHIYENIYELYALKSQEVSGTKEALR